MYSACRSIRSRIIESAAFCNQIFHVPLYINSTQNSWFSWIVRLLLSLLCWPKTILLSSGHCSQNRKYNVSSQWGHLYYNLLTIIGFTFALWLTLFNKGLLRKYFLHSALKKFCSKENQLCFKNCVYLAR